MEYYKLMLILIQEEDKHDWTRMKKEMEEIRSHCLRLNDKKKLICKTSSELQSGFAGVLKYEQILLIPNTLSS